METELIWFLATWCGTVAEQIEDVLVRNHSFHQL